MHIIGLHGYTGTGKDTIAAHLVSKRWKRVSFADPVYKMLYALNPIVSSIAGGYYRVQDIVDDIGWDAAKRIYPEIRTLLQRLATEACRSTFGNYCFVELAQTDIQEAEYCDCPGVIVTDVRHDIEGEMLLDVSHGRAMIFEVTRPGYGPINSHSSEHGLSRKYIAETIANDSDVDGLNASIDQLLKTYQMV